MLDYLRGSWSGIGHTPLGALSVVALARRSLQSRSVWACSQDEDGIYAGPLADLVSSDASDEARDIHELWFNVVLALIVLHVAAILFYRLRGQAA